jgi:hypothetical protein
MRQQSHRVSFQIKSDPYLESVNHIILRPNFNSSPFDTFSCPFLKAGAHSFWHVRCQKNHALCADVSFKLGGEIGATRLKAVASVTSGTAPENVNNGIIAALLVTNTDFKRARTKPRSEDSFLCLWNCIAQFGLEFRIVNPLLPSTPGSARPLVPMPIAA